MPRKRPIDPNEIRRQLLQHGRDYLRTTPVAERSPSMLKAITEIVQEVGPAYQKEVGYRARMQALAAGTSHPFPVPTTERVPGERNANAAAPVTGADLLNKGAAVPFDPEGGDDGEVYQ